MQYGRMLLGGQYFCIIKINKENSRSVCYKQEISGSTIQKQTKYLLLTGSKLLIVEHELNNMNSKVFFGMKITEPIADILWL